MMERVILIDCRPLCDPQRSRNYEAKRHIGYSGQILEGIVRHSEFCRLWADVRDQFVKLRREDHARRIAVVFYCTAGIHRSVAMAALFADVVERRLGQKVAHKHLSREIWERRKCGPCLGCLMAKYHSESAQYAYQVAHNLWSELPRQPAAGP